MKPILVTFFTLFLFQVGCAQEIIADSLFQPNQPVEETVKPSNVPKESSEKLAWEMMFPPGYKRQIKSTEKIYFENLLLRMKSGVAELSLDMGEFDVRPVEKNKVHSNKKTRPGVAGRRE